MTTPDNVRTSQGGLTVDFEDNRLLGALFGDHDSNLARIEQELGVSLTSRGNRMVIGGDTASCERARGILDARVQLSQRGLDGEHQERHGHERGRLLAANDPSSHE